MNFLERCIAASTVSREDRSREDELILKYYEQVRNRMDRMRKARGRLYASATFDNFETKNKDQRDVVRALKEYAKDFPNRFEAGQNIIIAGPSGTGKDHLLMALSMEIFGLHGVPSHWEQGIDLLNDLRSSEFGRTTRPSWNDNASCLYHDDITRLQSMGVFAENVMFSSFEPIENVSPILWISDALPPSGPLTEYQQATLFGLVDRRYSRGLPNWLTLNVADKDDWKNRMGKQTVDRLRDRALLLKCPWESHRKPWESLNTKGTTDSAKV